MHRNCVRFLKAIHMSQLDGIASSFNEQTGAETGCARGYVVGVCSRHFAHRFRTETVFLRHSGRYCQILRFHIS